MQRTEKYFEQNAYRREAVGHILAAEPDSRTGGGRIALDGTVFYPEGGGQPADRGTLTLADRHRCPRAGGCHLAHGHFPARRGGARGRSGTGHRLGMAL